MQFAEPATSGDADVAIAHGMAGQPGWELFGPWDDGDAVREAIVGAGYGNYVKFDHDFVGRQALEQMADAEHRRKVTLALDDSDVTRTIGTMFQKTDRAKTST